MDDEKFKMLLEAAPEAIIIVDESGKITIINSQCEKYFGYRREELLGQPVEILVPNEVSKAHTIHRQKYMKHPTMRPMGTGINLRAKRKDGSTFPVDISLSPLVTKTGTLITAIIHDITEHKQLEEKLKYLAEHDQLTGLINRNLFEDRLNQFIRLAKRKQWQIAVLFLDVDNFKEINDTYGHAVGDLLLCAVVRRIQGCIRETDTFARVGGDEFVLILVDVAKANDIVRFTKKILQRFRDGFLINHINIAVTLSIGIALYPQDGIDQQSLLEKADAAMYFVKKHGKNNFQFASAD